MRLFCIYSLTDPATKKIRYVGLTCNLKRRLREHRQRAVAGTDKTHKGCWLRQLYAAGSQPEVKILEDRITTERCDTREVYWIAKLRRAGHELTNHLAGGRTRPTYTASSAAREKIRQAHRGRPKTVEHRQRLSVARTGKVHSVETRQKMSVAHRGKRQSVAAVVKTAAAHLGSKRSDETRLKMVKRWEHRRSIMQLELLTKLDKSCSQCGHTKPLTEFHADKHSADGRVSSCKLCRGSNDRKLYAVRRGNSEDT